ncbi:serine/threonine-protein phosphatase 6 regulatory ankyrin repeat subunit A [Lingula anatina]|uniref:Serine/threonine-protein phosphatase 6 regulatory ankyrin repeat subunit A n=1 Tax=Lingula anatina TaxID=7574 RepID=A0A1S3K384_LINAN|nr:serine/threonine-protein phosphatase 6 regulatory ankyrin repeat subunit A [Lingula anatina]|eukprot:XP_013417088.1 serine/threonine-protein phosphatase 6 regulatory ankyrin repeat subunit A [Lingula anatina]
MSSVLDAVQSNSARILQLLIAIPGSIRQKELDRALLQAAKLGYHECALHLLQAGADPDFSDASSNSPLKISVENGHTQVAKVLIAAECDINKRTNSGSTALHFAARYGKCDSVDLLLAANVNPTIRDSAGNTPLISAAKAQQVPVMRRLLQVKCAINAKNKEGMTALHYACLTGMGVELLINAGADLNVKDTVGNTPIIIAATEGLCKTIRKLCLANCDVNLCNTDQQRTALHYMAMKGHVECVEELLYAGAHPDIPDAGGCTPLWHAINRNQIGVAKLLLRSNCGFGFKNYSFKCDTSMLQLALEKGHPEIVKMLVIAGCDSHRLGIWLANENIEQVIRENVGLWDWLQEMAATPNTLKQLCRLCVREAMNHEVICKTEHLFLPQAMKDYIALKELDDYH